MSAPRLVIFDLDGTLIDTVALVVEAVTNAFVSVGREGPDEKAIRSISGLGLFEGVRRIAPDADEMLVTELGNLYRREYLAAASASMREALFPGALDMLKALDARNDTLLAVATGKPLVGTKRVLKAHDLLSLFTSLQTPDTNMSKPNPEMIFTAMSVVGADPEQTVMIGDTNHDIDMALAAGVKSVGVSWGYHPIDELRAAGADMIIDDFSALSDAIEKLVEN